MARSEFERRADQLRTQMETLRESADELVKGYNRFLTAAGDFVNQAQRPMMDFARQARGNVERVREETTSPGPGFAWWMPVAALCAIGCGYWLFTTFFPRAAEERRDQFSSTFNNMSGS